MKIAYLNLNQVQIQGVKVKVSEVLSVTQQMWL